MSIRTRVPDWIDEIQSTLPPMLTVAQVAEHIQRCQRTVRSYIATGALEAARGAGVRCILVPRASLIRFLRGERAAR